MPARPSIYFKNDDLLDAVDNLSDELGVKRSPLIVYLLTQVVNAMEETTPIETSTGMKIKLKLELEFNGK